MINSNREELNSIIHVQQNLMKILFFYVEKIVHSLDVTSSTYSKDILTLLEKSQTSLEYCNENVNLLNSLISDFNNSSENLEINYANSIIKINNNIAFIENYIYSSLQCFELSLPVVTQSREKITEFAKVKPENKIPEEILNKDNLKGEMVLIIEGNKNMEKENDLNKLSLEEHYKYYEKQGLTKNEIIKKIAKDKGVNKNEIYQLFI